MNTSLSHRQWLWLATLLVIAMLIGLFRLGTSLKEQFRSYQLIEERLYTIEHADEIKRNQVISIKELEIRVDAIQEGKIRIQNHLDFVHYLENLAGKHQIKVIALPQEETTSEGEFVLSKEAFQLEGKLQSILQLLFEIERTDQIGIITYASLQREEFTFRGKRTPFLIASIELKRLTQTKKP